MCGTFPLLRVNACYPSLTLRHSVTIVSDGMFEKLRMFSRATVPSWVSLRLEIDLHASLKDVDVSLGLVVGDATKAVIEAPFDM